MSQENAEVVRKPLRVRERSSRSLDERLFLRLGWLNRRFRRFDGRLSPESRVWQAMVARGARLGFEAFNRRDFDATLLNYHSDLQFFPPRAMIESGVVASSYRGHDGYREFMGKWLSAWGSYRGEPRDLIVLADRRLLILGQLKADGEASGVPITQEYASLMTFKDGQVIRQQEYFDHAEALKTVGLSE
jgi:ketosteroid isomerase-like protein